MAMTLMSKNEDTGTDEEEQRVQREERAASNRAWRARREREKLGLSPREQKKVKSDRKTTNYPLTFFLTEQVDKVKRNKALGSLLRCSGCGGGLGGGEVWQCRAGHPTCQVCILGCLSSTALFSMLFLPL